MHVNKLSIILCLCVYDRDCAAFLSYQLTWLIVLILNQEKFLPIFHYIRTCIRITYIFCFILMLDYNNNECRELANALRCVLVCVHVRASVNQY